MDIGKCFRDAWGLFKLDLGPLLVTAVIGAVITGAVMAVALGASLAATLATSSDGTASGLAIGGLIVGVLVTIVVSVVVGGWMYATLYGMLLARVRGRVAASYGDMSKFFALVGPFILATLVLGIIIGLGYMLLIIPGVIFTTWWLLTLVIMADQGIGFGEAMSASKELSARVGFWNMLVTWLVGGIAWGVASTVLGYIPYLGSVLAMLIVPFALAYTVSMYLQARGEGHLVDEALGLAPAAGAGATAAPGLPVPPPPGPSAYAAPAPRAPEAKAAPAGDDAWRAAADPVAAQAAGRPAETPPVADEDAPPAPEAQTRDAEAPPAPEPPAPPAPPQT